MSLLARLRQSALLLDDDGLAALANKGLVRRARKDIEAKLPEIKGESDGQLLVAVEDQTVRLAERLPDSRCSCPAGGRCRHVVAAVLALGRMVPAESAPEGKTGDTLLDVDDEALRRFAGAALLRQAQQQVARGLRAECSDGPALVVRFPDWNVTCRFVGQGGLAGAVCGCHATEACLHAVAAVLVFQIQQGRRQPLPLSETLDASDETPRTREDIRQAALSATQAMITRGFSRLDAGMAERFLTLATSAHGVDLPRLERALRGISDEIQRWLQREVSASDQSLLLRAAQVHALARALATPKPELVGQHRSRYEPVRDLELVGAGAHVWRTASGYQGLTVYFWEPTAGRFSTWSEARPTSVADFNPVARFLSAGPWSSCPSPREASASRIRLPQAHRNRSGRLSGRPGTTMIRLGKTSPELFSPMVDWSALAERARLCFAVRPVEADENMALVVLRPERWGQALFDPQRQELRLPVADPEGRQVLLVLPQTPENDAAIKDLESLRPEPGTLLCGRLAITGGHLCVQPFSIIDGVGVRSLGLEGVLGGRGAPAASEDSDEDPESPEGPERTLALASPLGLTLARAWDELEALAASGAGARHRPSSLVEIREALQALGLARVAAALSTVMATRGQTADLPRALLDAAWIVHIAESLLVVERALSELG